MKNQNDLIVAGAVILVCVGVSLGFMLTKRKPDTPPSPPNINVSDAKPPDVGIVMSTGLPGGSTRGGGGNRGPSNR